MSDIYTLITGASGGIGKAFAEELAKRGNNLILIARREEVLRDIAARLRQEFSVKVEIRAVDLINSEQRANELDTLFQSFTITHVINNAGMGHYQKFVESNLAASENTIKLNIDALVEVTHRAANHMQKHGKSSQITNIASMAAFVSMAQYSIYCGTKHFVRSFTEALAIELKESNIHFTCISPGGVATDFLEKAGQELHVKKSLVLMEPDLLVKKSLKAIGNKKLHYTPGLINQITLILMKILPKQLGNKVATFGMRKATGSH